MTWQLVYGEQARQPGFWASPYSAIHHNFSVETPRLIAAFTLDTMFGGGDPRVFVELVDALKAFPFGDARADHAGATGAPGRVTSSVDRSGEGARRD